jgi:hypothetical protein
MKHVRQLDYACLKGERVWWPNVIGEKFEGIILEWDKSDGKEIATLKLDDGTEKIIEC